MIFIKATVSLAIGLGILMIIAAALAPLELPVKAFVGLVGLVIAGAGVFNRH